MSRLGNDEVSEQLAPERPVILYHLRFEGPTNNPGSSTVPDGPHVGVLLWIESPAGAAGSAAAAP